uniref:Laminin EGF-like domain-containing protein n=1 Tax=Heterorhabditis bacteriophora TaxID=37862 RepID=A0A1I7X379_HETBA
MCENCTENAWNYHPLMGCNLCECSDIGSIDGKCDTNTGQVRCRKEYVGLKCDRCTHGFFNFPKCEPCDCVGTVVRNFLIIATYFFSKFKLKFHISY